MTERSGWAYGQFIGSRDWLTIPGSAYRAPVLHASQEQAQAALDAAGYTGAMRDHTVTAYVTEVWHGGVSGRGYAYKITEAGAGEQVTPGTTEG